MPYDSPDGPITDLFGREVAPVRVSAPQEKVKGLQTLVISGHIGHPSSGSAALQQSLESRLHQRLDTAGSTLFTLTWKRRRTPLGRPYLERAVSVRRTSGSGCTSVPTPQEGDKRSGQAKRYLEQKHALRINDCAMLATVPTPMAGSPATDTCNAAGNNDYSRKIVELASVATPRSVESGHSTGNPARALDKKSRLEDQVFLATVTTPSARDWKDTSGMSETGVDPDGSIRSRLDQLPRQAQLAATGPTATGGTGKTASIGQLNPEYSRWLMGLPIEFSSCADTAMQSARPSRQSSSRHLAK
jgi:hypothetical protein